MTAPGTSAAVGKRVLVVEDEPDIVELISFNLRTAGYAVTTATTGAAALEAARHEPPDLIVLDLMLPEIDGFSVCEILRREPATARVPVIMVTAWAAEQSRLLGLELGADDYLTKPFSPRELVLRVDRLLQRSRGRLPLRLRDLVIDLERHQVTLDGRAVTVSAKEFRLLAHLVETLLERTQPAGDFTASSPANL